MHQSWPAHSAVLQNCPHLVSCFLLKRSLMTGVPLNILPRYKDLTLFATAKGTHGIMFYNQNTFFEHLLFSHNRIRTKQFAFFSQTHSCYTYSGLRHFNGLILKISVLVLETFNLSFPLSSSLPWLNAFLLWNEITLLRYSIRFSTATRCLQHYQLLAGLHRRSLCHWSPSNAQEHIIKWSGMYKALVLFCNLHGMPWHLSSWSHWA